MIWLIGNRGMLGAEVEALLKKQGLPYMATDLELDIADPDQAAAFIEGKPVSFIINCAAYTAVDQAEDEPGPAFRANADGPLNLARIARAKQAKLIHISSDYVFDGTKTGPYGETDTPHPLGIYGQSKYTGEQNIIATTNAHFIIRTAWLYGRHGRNFVYTVLRLLQERKELRVVGDQFGSPTYAPDLAAAILKIVQEGRDRHGIYHFTNEGRTSWYLFACAIADIAKKQGKLPEECRVFEITTDQYPTKAKRPANSVLSTAKIQNSFNLHIRPWQAALEEFLFEVNIPEPTG